MKKQLGTFLLAICILLTGIPAVSAQEDTVTIATVADFLAFAECCTLDSWSVGKRVELTADIDLAKEKDFDGIASFGGTFDGQGHKISGFFYTKNGSNRGLFRYVQKSGMIKNLNVSATVTPGGTQSTLGGIVGQNEGKILQSTFAGTVTGSSNIGGIAGQNLADGVISDCTSQGAVYGEHYAGGIVGKNLGNVISCTNKGGVNTVSREVSVDLEKLDLEHLRTTQNLADVTDVGGIAGFSAGILQSCTNEGKIGYERVGYNIGGVAGRQSGYLDSCLNKGTVLGRKDVGGIAGQIEPYTSLQYDGKNLDSINSQLNRLQSLTDGLLDRADDYRINAAGQLRKIQNYTSEAVDETKVLSEKTEQSANREIEQINDTSARLTAAINQMSEQLARGDDIAKDLNDFSSQLRSSLDKLGDAVQIDTDRADQAMDDLTAGLEKLERAGKELSRALVTFRQVLNDAEDISQAAKNLLKSIENLKDSLQACRTAVKELETVFGELEQALRDQNYEKLAELFSEMRTLCGTIYRSLGDVIDHLELLSQAFSQLNDSLIHWDSTSLLRAIRDLADVIYEMNSAMVSLRKAVQGFREVLQGIDFDTLQGIPDEISSAMISLEHGITTLGDSMLAMSNILQDLGQKPILSIDKIDSEVMDSIDRLHDKIKGITKVMEQLRQDTDDAASPLNSDLKEITRQLRRMVEDVTDALPDLSEDLEDRFQDVSEEDTAAQTTGKVDRCTNSGEVRGEVNTGGIAGSMAIEYDFDPEDDLTVRGDRSSNFLYTTRAIIRSCRSDGTVTGKKDGVGGIVGNMALGCVFSSQSSGRVTSTGGDQVGGIAGVSESVIKNCSSKAILSGDDNIGGIVGKGKHVNHCRAAANILEGDENIGGIAGEASGTLAENYYCGNAEGAVDSVSYAGKAEKTSYETVLSMEGSSLFRTFRATFYLEEEPVGTVEYPYGGSISENQLPTLPEKEGKYVEWENAVFDHLTGDIAVYASYLPYVTSIEGKELRRDGLPAVVCEGEFKDGTSLDMIPLTGVEASAEAWQISTSDGSPIRTVHYRPLHSKRKITVRLDSDEKYKVVKTGRDGSYLVFDGGKDTLRFLIKEKTPFPLWGKIVLGCAGGLLAAGLLLLFVMKKRNEKKTV